MSFVECNPALRTFEDNEIVAERGGTWGWWGRDFAKTGKIHPCPLNSLKQVRNLAPPIVQISLADSKPPSSPSMLAQVKSPHPPIRFCLSMYCFALNTDRCLIGWIYITEEEDPRYFWMDGYSNVRRIYWYPNIGSVWSDQPRVSTALLPLPKKHPVFQIHVKYQTWLHNVTLTSFVERLCSKPASSKA